MLLYFVSVVAIAAVTASQVEVDIFPSSPAFDWTSQQLEEGEIAASLESVLLESGYSVPCLDDTCPNNATASLHLSNSAASNDETNLLEISSTAEVERVHGYCEICIRMLQMYQRGLPDVCSGLTDTFFITCVKNLESILKADRAVVYWNRIGCVHMDDGPEVVRPCPAHVICGWVPNIFARRTGITQQIGQLAPLCPRDVNYLPRVPRTMPPGGLPGS